jgi:hypothetical protein
MIPTSHWCKEEVKQTNVCKRAVSSKRFFPYKDQLQSIEPACRVMMRSRSHVSLNGGWLRYVYQRLSGISQGYKSNLQVISATIYKHYCRLLQQIRSDQIRPPIVLRIFSPSRIGQGTQQARTVLAESPTCSCRASTARQQKKYIVSSAADKHSRSYQQPDKPPVARGHHLGPSLI